MSKTGYTAKNQPPSDEHPTVSTTHLERLQRMDPEGWSRLVTTFGPIVYRWCRSSGVNPDDSADVVQEVFTSVARGVGDFERLKAEGSFRSWLATITRNRVRDYIRKQNRSPVGMGGTEAMIKLQQQSDPDAEDVLDSTICGEDVYNPLVHRVLTQVQAEFEQKTWRAFWLSAVENKTAADIASQTGLSTASVYQSKSRVLRRIRQRLSEFPE